jgi:hypothetical protein
LGKQVGPGANLSDFGRVDTPIHGFFCGENFCSMAGHFCPGVKSKIEQLLLIYVDQKLKKKKLYSNCLDLSLTIVDKPLHPLIQNV